MHTMNKATPPSYTESISNNSLNIAPPPYNPQDVSFQQSQPANLPPNTIIIAQPVDNGKARRISTFRTIIYFLLIVKSVILMMLLCIYLVSK